MISQRELEAIAEEVRGNRKERQSRLIGYCYENAQEMSRLLDERGIDHAVYYVGIIEEMIQGRDNNVDRDMCERASRTGEYSDELPSTKAELPDEYNHYVVGVEVGGELYAVEPCAEARDRFREAHASPWPHDEYMLLKDSRQS
jgi:hypothetical protein